MKQVFCVLVLVLSIAATSCATDSCNECSNSKKTCSTNTTSIPFRDGAVSIDGDSADWADAVKKPRFSIPIRTDFDSKTQCPKNNTVVLPVQASDVVGLAYARWDGARLCFLFQLDNETLSTASNTAYVTIGSSCKLNSTKFKVETYGKFIFNSSATYAVAYEICLPEGAASSENYTHFYMVGRMVVKIDGVRVYRVVSTGGDNYAESCRRLATVGESTSSGLGDPIVETWDKQLNMFYETGDYIAAHSQLFGLALHLRFGFQMIPAHAPYTIGLALRCSRNSGYVELFPEEDPKFHDLNTDAVIVTETNRGFHGGYDVTCVETGFNISMLRQRSHGKNHFDVLLAGAGKITDLVGLFGSPDRNYRNDCMTRDGVTLQTDDFLSVEDSIVLQKSWIVRDSEAMFSVLFPTLDTPLAMSGHDHGKAILSQHGMLKRGRSMCHTAGIPEYIVEMCARDFVASNGNVESIHNLLQFLMVHNKLQV